MNDQTAEEAPNAPPTSKKKSKTAGKASPSRERAGPTPSSASSQGKAILRSTASPLPASPTAAAPPPSVECPQTPQPEARAEARPVSKNKGTAAGKAAPQCKREETARSSAPAHRTEPLRPTMSPMPAQLMTALQALAERNQNPAPEARAGLPPQSLPPPETQAHIIEQFVIPALMATALGMDRYVNGSGFQAYLEKIRKDAGNPTDPIEVMLLEQAATAHLRTAQLQSRAATAEGLEAAKLYNAAAARMLSEFRQTAITLKVYREPGSGRSP
jgi:hypothetical protein